MIIGVQLIKSMEVNSGGLVVAFWTAALEGKGTGVWWSKISFKMVPKVMFLFNYVWLEIGVDDW